MEENRRYEYQTASPDRYDILKECAREMRRNMTEAETVLWNKLKNNPYKFRFRRQHPIADFIADFICIEGKLVIEVDGGYHQTAEQMESDASRTRILNNMGYTVMRFTNEEVMFQTESVTRKIYDWMM